MSSNIDPSIWGEAGWIFLRNIAKGYPDTPTPLDKENYKKYFESIANVLPCSKCRANYKNHWKEIPITNYLANKNMLLKWVNTIKSKSVSAPRPAPKTTTVSERIARIKNARLERAKAPKQCGRCGNKK